MGRNQIYKDYAHKLLESGRAYRCFCTDEELEKMKEEAAEEGRPPVYSGPWADASESEIQEMLDENKPHTIRFRVPEDTVILIDDVIRGQVEYNTNVLGDFIIMRSNGQPVYNFCVAIDDGLMGITHVVRGEEHLNNSLRQVLIYG